MSAPNLRPQLLTKMVGCKASRGDVNLPGDYAWVTLDQKLSIILICPICEKEVLVEDVMIEDKEPLTLKHECECPTGCKFRITNGRIFAI